MFSQCPPSVLCPSVPICPVSQIQFCFMITRVAVGVRVLLSWPSWWGTPHYFCWILGVVSQAFMSHFNCLKCNLPEFSFIPAGCANPPGLTSPLPSCVSHWSGGLLFHLESLHRPAQLQRTFLSSLSPHSPFP